MNALLARIGGRTVVIAVPFLFLLVFFLFPFVIVGKISVSEMETVSFKDVLTWSDGVLTLALRFSNYVFITEDPLYFKTYLASLHYALVTTLLCLFIGYPFAYFMAREAEAVTRASYAGTPEFRAAKLATVGFYFSRILPRTLSHAAGGRAGASSLTSDVEAALA